MVFGAGMLGSGVTIDYSQLVLDAEIASLIKVAVNGIAVTDETLSVDAISEVGQFGDFFSHPDTYRYMRDLTHPTLIDRRVREAWEADGSRTAADRALEKAREILDTHVPPPLPEGAAEAMTTIIADAEEKIGARVR